MIDRIRQIRVQGPLGNLADAWNLEDIARDDRRPDIFPIYSTNGFRRREQFKRLARL